MEQKNFAVIGHPIGHTMSPFIHSRLFALEEKKSSYGIRNILPEELFSAMPKLRELSGFNITIPHKQAIIPFLDAIDDKAKFFHSVNTVKNENGRLIGYTTDGTGFTMALQSAGFSLNGKNLLLGAGGVSRVMAFEILAAAKKLDITIAVREHSLPAAEALCKTLKEVLRTQGYDTFSLSFCTLEQIVPQNYDLLINGTPVGMYPHTDSSPVNASVLKNCAAVFDAVYNPNETMLLKLAKQNGAKVLGGMSMLVWQAAAAHKIWDGASYASDAMQALCKEAVAEMNQIFPA